MDPNTTLKEIRAVIGSIDKKSPLDLENVLLAAHLADLVEALDQWLTRGGFLPDDWQRKEGGTP